MGGSSMTTLPRLSTTGVIFATVGLLSALSRARLSSTWFRLPVAAGVAVGKQLVNARRGYPKPRDVDERFTCRYLRCNALARSSKHVIGAGEPGPTSGAVHRFS